MDEMACDVCRMHTALHAVPASKHSFKWFARRVTPSHPVKTTMMRAAVRPHKSAAKPLRFTLDNGLTVLLQENHSAPVVALNMWVKVGSIYEREDAAGISHMYEHMLFKGTTTRGVGEIAQEIEGCGGDINAFTSFDHTVYHITLASRYLETG